MDCDSVAEDNSEQDIDDALDSMYASKYGLSATRGDEEAAAAAVDDDDDDGDDDDGDARGGVSSLISRRQTLRMQTPAEMSFILALQC